jgi:hypothetical protein
MKLLESESLPVEAPDPPWSKVARLAFDVVLILAVGWLGGFANGYLRAIGEIKPRIAAVEKEQAAELQAIQTQVDVVCRAR